MIAAIHSCYPTLSKKQLDDLQFTLILTVNIYNLFICSIIILCLHLFASKLQMKSTNISLGFTADALLKQLRLSTKSKVNFTSNLPRLNLHYSTMTWLVFQELFF